MLLVGLGNPGKKYDGTRHNVGFIVLDSLVNKLAGRWKKDEAAIWSKIGNHMFIKPTEYMNVSGPALKKFLTFKHLDLTDPTQLIVIHDDLDFPLGEIHLHQNRSAGGHNGVQSIIDALGTQSFYRLRIGIGNNRDVQVPAEEYVLQKFSATERPVIDSTIQSAVEHLLKKIQG